ncbi:MAG: RecB-family nuclease [Candidatus Hodarchaeales archaeon]
MTFENLLMTLHNSHSRNMVKLFADTCIGLGCKNVIYSKITAAAASIGIPEAQKYVLNNKGNLLFFSDIEDIIETLRPNKTFLIVSKKYSQTPISFSELAKLLQKNKILVILGGTSPGLTRKDMDIGESVHIEQIPLEVNPIAQTALFINLLKEKMNES